MGKAEHYNKTYSENQEATIKCYLLSKEPSGYRARGVRREVLKLLMSEDKMESKSLEKGFWYEIKGKITEQEDYNLTIDVRELECIGVCVNDWIFSNTSRAISRTPKAQQTGGILTASVNSVGAVENASTRMTEDMSGFAAGGGKDIDNFRKNIQNNKLPHPDSISHEGILYDYEFNIGVREKNTLFYPNYEQAVSKNPVTGDKERYLTVGLDSGIDSFERPPLDLMFAIDISGSMGGAMEQYYYDSPEQRDSSSDKNKMEATKDVLKNVIQKLNTDDRFGIVFYNQQGTIGKPLRSVSNVDTEKIISEIDDLRESGGTNLLDGFNTAVDEIKEFADINTGSHNRESRIMFMTDAMTNTGETGELQIEKRFKEVADENIYTTFIGVGIDTNPDLIDTLTSTRGANHYFVDSVEEFNEKINKEFTYAVTPLVFDLSMIVEGDGFEIDGVYGSPNEDASTSGEVMNVKTLFPSHGDEGTKGGVIVISISEAEPGDNVRISTSWTERDGSKGGDVTQVRIVDEDEYYESSDTRKAVTLCQYVKQLRAWLEDTNVRSDSFERGSTELRIPENHKVNLTDFLYYLESQADNLEDNKLHEEIETLRNIVGE
jgi:Ca-activated chloride channel family protein